MSSIESAQIRDIDLHGITIVNHDRRAAIDLRPITIEFNLYTSIYTGFMTADITLIDAEGLIERLPILGEEIVFLSFSLPEHHPDSSQTLTHAFHVYKIDNRTPHEERSELYTIRLCSPQAIISLSKQVDRAYVGKRMDEIVSSSFQEYVLNDEYFDAFHKFPDDPRNIGFVNRKIVTSERTKGLHSIIAPLINPFEFINYLCSESVSEHDNSASDFIFYENRHGFNFRTISSMLNAESKVDIYRAEVDVEDNPGNDDPSLRDAIISESMVPNDWLDIIKNHTGGLYQNKIATYDLLRKKNIQHNYSYAVDTYQFKEKNPKIATVDQWKISSRNSYFDHRPYSLSRYLIGQINAEANEYKNAEYLKNKVSDSNNNVFDQISTYPFTKHLVLGQRTTKYALFDNGIKVQIIIPGNHTLDPGDIVHLFSPQATLNDDHKTKYNWLFGSQEPRFLITDLCHRYDLTTGRFRTFATVVKDSLGSTPQKTHSRIEDLFVS